MSFIQKGATLNPLSTLPPQNHQWVRKLSQMLGFSQKVDSDEIVKCQSLCQDAVYMSSSN